MSGKISPWLSCHDTSAAEDVFPRKLRRPDGAEQLKPSAARMQPQPCFHICRSSADSLLHFLLRLLHVCRVTPRLKASGIVL